MPIFNLTVDDTSPLIRYEPPGVWIDSSHSDPAWPSYLNGTFHATNQINATATLTFNGSAVYVFGAFSINHDAYSVTLDGQTTIKNGSSNRSAEAFQQVVFSATRLNASEHQLVLQNTYTTASPSWFDVDFVDITTGDGDDSSPRNDVTFDDGDKNISYFGYWHTPTNNITQSLFNGTMHHTNQNNAGAMFTFEGNSIAAFGTTSPAHGMYSVQLDDGVPTVLNGTSPELREQSLLYYAGGLTRGTHAVTFLNIDEKGMAFDLDRLVVSQWGEWDLSSQSSPSSTAGPSSKGSTVVIIGATVAATIASVLLFVGLKLFRRRYCGRPTKDGALVTGSDEVLLEPIQPYPYETSTDTARVPPNERAISKVEQMPQALLDPARATSHSLPNPLIDPPSGGSVVTGGLSSDRQQCHSLGLDTIEESPPSSDSLPPSYDEVAGLGHDTNPSVTLATSTPM